MQKMTFLCSVDAFLKNDNDAKLNEHSAFPVTSLLLNKSQLALP